MRGHSFQRRSQTQLRDSECARGFYTTARKKTYITKTRESIVPSLRKLSSVCIKVENAPGKVTSFLFSKFFTYLNIVCAKKDRKDTNRRLSYEFFTDIHLEKGSINLLIKDELLLLIDEIISHVYVVHSNLRYIRKSFLMEGL